MTGYEPLPPDLPAPVDDGSASHLPGTVVPSLVLPSSGGGAMDLGALPAARTVVYLYPMTGRPGVASPQGWDAIPGARGCTPEACGFRDHHAELRSAGAEVLGISSQPTDQQREAARRLSLPFPLLSDPDLRLADVLGLPTFVVDGRPLFTRLTLVLRGATIEHVFFPVFPPDNHADEVVRWLRGHPA
jgi:peroxiredoxin